MSNTRIEYQKNYRLLHKKEHNLASKKWRKSHPEYIREYNKNWYHSCIKNRVSNILRSRITYAIKNNQKGGHLLNLLGCSIKKLTQHLETQFQQGMTWDNYGEWQIDHIKPCASFDLSKISEQKICFNYKNLQPLWAKDNQSKGVKIYD